MESGVKLETHKASIDGYEPEIEVINLNSGEDISFHELVPTEDIDFRDKVYDIALIECPRIIPGNNGFDSFDGRRDGVDEEDDGFLVIVINSLIVTLEYDNPIRWDITIELMPQDEVKQV